MDSTYDKMTEALKRDDLVGALKVLNDRVPHRYSAVYRMAPDDYLVIVAFVDKQGKPCPSFLLSVHRDVSFCQFAMKHEDGFRTSNSAEDKRLDGHPYQGLVNSYHAAPFMSVDGRVKGTICHFDKGALPLPDEDFELLRLASRVFPIHLRQALETVRDPKRDNA
ncbi:GAF domain-containing protein [Variovorax sp. LT1P1]|uniref:GAF domain-containing protein n=1 Tax=Variovorax sp. LT1P1 TaxID=3443730 RepID=UPI003F44C18D